MLLKFSLVWLLLVGRSVASSSEQEDVGFTYNGFRGVNMTLNGLAQIIDEGLLMLVNTTTQHTTQQQGHAFYPHPLHFTNSSTGDALSFSTTFVFDTWKSTRFGGPGMAFVIAPSKEFPGAFPGNYLGLLNTTTNGNSSNHLIAIELDFLKNPEFDDIDGNHVGIDINDLKSIQSSPASYFSSEKNSFVKVNLTNGQSFQVWVEYYGAEKQLNVTLAPVNIPKPKVPLLSLRIDLAQVMVDPMFVGFSSATYSLPLSYYVLGWSFKLNGEARELNLSQLPKPPHHHGRQKMMPRPLIVVFSVVGATLVLIFSFFTVEFVMKRKNKYTEVLEDWELNYEPHRFKYKDLYIATKGFKDTQLLGTGGFGSVFRGFLPTTKTDVAVKRISHNSKQGEREFIAEIVSIGRLRHRSIVELFGYCRRKAELLLVYDFMPNGSLDKFLFNETKTKTVLAWDQRFRIVKDVAAALLYLHEDWEHIVVHRDVKSSNILLDKKLKAKLGDFGLARSYDHGSDLHTTHVVGTLGYLAPEFCRTGKTNPNVDVFAFGVVLLEVACGRRPIETQASEECIVLVDWVISCWSKGNILETADPKLGMNYRVEEMELVLKLGLLCSHSIPTARPHMGQVMRYLNGEVSLPELNLPGQQTGSRTMTRLPSVAESLLSQGR